MISEDLRETFGNLQPLVQAPVKNKGGRPKGSKTKNSVKMREAIMYRAEPVEFLMAVQKGQIRDHLDPIPIELRVRVAMFLCNKILGDRKSVDQDESSDNVIVHRYEFGPVNLSPELSGSVEPALDAEYTDVTED